MSYLHKNGLNTAAVAATVAAAFLLNAEAVMPRLTVWDTGSAIYARCPWNSTHDFVWKLCRDSGTLNHNFNFLEVGLLAVATPSTGTPTLTTSLSSFLDDTTGYQVPGNSIRVGGNHICEMLEVTKAGHGLVAGDISKRFQDTGGNYYRITKIVDANRFWLIQQPKTVVSDTTGTAYVPTAATTLTGLDGLSNLTGWTAAYTVGTGLGLLNLVQHVYAGGMPLIPKSPAIMCDRLEVVQYEECPNVKGGYDYFGTAGAAGTWENAGKMWSRHQKFTFHPWAQLNVQDSFTIDFATRFNEANGIQFNPLLGTTGSTNLHWWMPGAAAKTFTGSTVNGVASPTLDFNSPVYFGGSCSGTDMDWRTADTVLAGGVVPDWGVQLCSPSSSSIAGWTVGHCYGLNPTWGYGVPAQRAVVTKENARIVMSTKKGYMPAGPSIDTMLAAGTTFQGECFRRWTPPVTECDFWTYTKSDDGKWWVRACWTTSPGATLTLPLPALLRNKTATLVRGHNASLTSANTYEGKLVIAPSAANGHIIVQLA